MNEEKPTTEEAELKTIYPDMKQAGMDATELEKALAHDIERKQAEAQKLQEAVAVCEDSVKGIESAQVVKAKQLSLTLLDIARGLADGDLNATTAEKIMELIQVIKELDSYCDKIIARING